MTAESLAIIAVIIVMSGIFLRARKKAVAILTLPLVSVPLFYLPARGIFSIARVQGLELSMFSCFLVVAGAIAGAAACALLSFFIPTKRGKTGYLAFSLAFELAIAIGYILNIL